MTYNVTQQNGQQKPFDPERLYRSIYRASLSAQANPGDAQLNAQRVVFATESWLQTQKSVTPEAIHSKAHEHLQFFHPAGARMYGGQVSHNRENPRFSAPATAPGNVTRPAWLDLGKNGNWD